MESPQTENIYDIPNWKERGLHLVALAKEALRLGQGDADAARIVMIEWLEDPAIRAELAETAVRVACGFAIASVRNRDRASIERRGIPTPQTAAILQDAWYRWPIPGGPPLGDAVLADVIEGRDLASKLARKNARNAQFLAAVADAMEARGETVVREALTPAELATMWDRTNG